MAGEGGDGDEDGGTRRRTQNAAPAVERPSRRAADTPSSGLLLGPALPTAHLAHERLGKPTALAVFASDNLSSVAYATEEILKVAVLAGIGAAAFTIVMPITIGILAILGILAVLLPTDDQGVPERRRRLHRHEGQLRAPAGADRRRGVAHGLRPDGVRLGRGRDRRRHVRRAGALSLPGVDVGVLHLVHRVGEPPRRAGVRADVRGPDLLLHPHDVPDARDRARSESSRAASTRSPSPPTSRARPAP